MNTERKRKLRDRLYAELTCKVCCYCGTKLTQSQATLEHVVPESQGGRSDDTNCKIACHPCNNERSCEDFNTYMEWKKSCTATYDDFSFATTLCVGHLEKAKCFHLSTIGRVVPASFVHDTRNRNGCYSIKMRLHGEAHKGTRGGKQICFCPDSITIVR